MMRNNRIRRSRRNDAVVNSETVSYSIPNSVRNGVYGGRGLYEQMYPHTVDSSMLYGTRGDIEANEDTDTAIYEGAMPTDEDLNSWTTTSVPIEPRVEPIPVRESTSSMVERLYREMSMRNDSYSYNLNLDGMRGVKKGTLPKKDSFQPNLDVK